MVVVLPFFTNLLLIVKLWSKVIYIYIYIYIYITLLLFNFITKGLEGSFYQQIGLMSDFLIFQINWCMCVEILIIQRSHAQNLALAWKCLILGSSNNYTDLNIFHQYIRLFIAIVAPFLFEMMVLKPPWMY